MLCFIFQLWTSVLVVLELLLFAVRSDSGTGLKVYVGTCCIYGAEQNVFFNCRVIMFYFPTFFLPLYLRWLYEQRQAKPQRGDPDWWSQCNHGLLQEWKQQPGLFCGWKKSEMVLYWRCRRDLPRWLSTNSRYVLHPWWLSSDGVCFMLNFIALICSQCDCDFWEANCLW